MEATITNNTDNTTTTTTTGSKVFCKVCTKNGIAPTQALFHQRNNSKRCPYRKIGPARLQDPASTTDAMDVDSDPESTWVDDACEAEDEDEDETQRMDEDGDDLLLHYLKQKAKPCSATADETQPVDDFPILLDQAMEMQSPKLEDLNELTAAMLKSREKHHILRVLLLSLITNKINSFQDHIREWFQPPPPYEAAQEAEVERQHESEAEDEQEDSEAEDEYQEHSEAEAEIEQQEHSEAEVEQQDESEDSEAEVEQQEAEQAPKAKITQSKSTPEAEVAEQESEVESDYTLPPKKRVRRTNTKRTPHQTLLDRMGYNSELDLYLPWQCGWTEGGSPHRRTDNADIDLMLRYVAPAVVGPNVGFQEHVRYILRGRHIEQRTKEQSLTENKRDREYLSQQKFTSSPEKALKNFNTKCMNAWKCVRLMGRGILVSNDHITKAGGNIYNKMTQVQLRKVAALLKEKELPTSRYDTEVEDFVKEHFMD
ncbi:hypothetical protein DFS34DRAFT_416782 [Phlyctochytrium arcticum]|nr:hypothetical protein DFS34DRAFT_416782 [Phlyctochytrium arcticum]